MLHSDQDQQPRVFDLGEWGKMHCDQQLYHLVRWKEIEATKDVSGPAQNGRIVQSANLAKELRSFCGASDLSL